MDTLDIIGRVSGVVKNPGSKPFVVDMTNNITNVGKSIIRESIFTEKHSSEASNKLFGVVLVSTSDSIGVDATLADIKANYDYQIIELDSISYVGSLADKYGSRSHFTYVNGTGDTFNVTHMGLITGYSAETPDTHRMLSIMISNFPVENSGTFDGDYLLSFMLRR